MKKYKVGQKITLVSRGIRRSDYGSDWVDQRQKGSAGFFEITRVGRKYLYGVYHHPNAPDARFRKNFYETKVSMEDHVILNGFDESAKKRYRQYITDLDNNTKAYNNALREIDRELNQVRNEKLKEWRTENPRPETLTIE